MRITSPPLSPIEGVLLRQIELGDCQAWFDYLRLPQVFEPTSWNLQHVDELRAIAADCLDGGPASAMRLAVVDGATARLVGTIGLHTVSPVNRSAEIAYDFAPDCWGRGLASRLCETVTSWSFLELGLHRLQATVLVGNQRSERVLARCGFRHEGLLRGFRMVRGHPGDFNIFARLAIDDAQERSSGAAGA